jgi:hypothetical protein
LKLSILIACFTALAGQGCAPRTSVNCADFDDDKIAQCFDRAEQKSDQRAMLLKCVPFSKSEKIEGLWLVGFEKNDFFEGRSSPRAADWAKDSNTELFANDEVIGRTMATQALQVTVKGRRSLCKFTDLTPNLIVAEEIVVRRRFAKP